MLLTFALIWLKTVGLAASSQSVTNHNPKTSEKKREKKSDCWSFKNHRSFRVILTLQWPEFAHVVLELFFTTGKEFAESR